MNLGTGDQQRAHAVVFAEAGRMEFREVTLRALGPGEVVVETRFSSISSGTERLIFGGFLPGAPRLRYPLIPGYESAGIVSAVGAGVTNVAVGDEVFVGGSVSFSDVAAAFGGQSSRLIKRAEQVVPLHGIPLRHAPILALAAAALHGVRMIGEVRNKRVAILGMGAIGRLAAMFLAALGADVFAADNRPARPADFAARSAGKIHAIDVSDAALSQALDGPVDVVIEATGRSGSIAECARAIVPGGAIVLLPYYENLATPFVDLYVKEAKLLISRDWTPGDLAAARDAIASGVINVSPLAGYVVPIERFESAYETAFADPSAVKVLLDWT